MSKSVALVTVLIASLAISWLLFRPGSSLVAGLFSNQQPLSQDQFDQLLQASTPLDATTLLGKPGLHYLNAGNLVGTLSVDRYSAYDDLVDEGKISQGSKIITDQDDTDQPPASTPQPSTLTALNSATLTITIANGSLAGAVIQQGLKTSLLTNDAGFMTNLLSFSTDDLDQGTTHLYSQWQTVMGGISYGSGVTLTSTLTLSQFTTNGGLIYTNASGQLSQLAAGTNGQCLKSTAGVPAWGACAATNSITGLGVNNYLAKFNGTDDLTSSLIFDDGTNVGIGTGSPNTSLHIVNSSGDAIINLEGSTATSRIRRSGNNILSANGGLTALDSGGALEFRSNGTALMTMLSSGNFGIGTTSPGGRLTVLGGSIVARETDDGNNAITLDTNTTEGAIRILRNGTNVIQLHGGAATVSYINTGYRFGIGTTSPQNILDVAGGVAIGSYAGVNTAPSNGLIVSGNVGIGKTNPGAALDVSGNGGTRAVSIGRTSSADLTSAGDYNLFMEYIDSSTGTSTQAARNALFVQYRKSGSGTHTSYPGVAIFSNTNIEAGTITTLEGVTSRINMTGGSLGDAINFVADAQYGTAGAVTNQRVGFLVRNYNLSGSQTLANQYGLSIQDLSGATGNNAGIRSAVSSGSSKYNLYLDGSAVSYIASNVLIGTLSAAAKLHVVSAAEQLRLGYDAANYASFTVTSSGGLSIQPRSGGPFTVTGSYDTASIVEGVTFSRNATWSNSSSSNINNVRVAFAPNSAHDQTGTLRAFSTTAYAAPPTGVTYSDVTGVYSESAIAGSGSAGLVSSAAAFRGGVSSTLTGGVVTNGYGMYILSPYTNAGTGSMGSAYGIRVATQSAVGVTSGYGVRIDDATTASLWFASDDGDVASGISFGASRDVALFRSAANTLRTNASFIAANNYMAITGSTPQLVFSDTSGGEKAGQIIVNNGVMSFAEPGVAERLYLNLTNNEGRLTWIANSTNLYSSAADTLRTDDLFVAQSGLITNGSVGVGTSSPLAKLDVKATNSVATLGSEMISSAADRDFSSDTGNWTGTNWSIGSGVATHTAGTNNFVLNAAALASPIVAGRDYKVTYTVTTTSGTSGWMRPQLGGTYGSNTGYINGTVTNFTSVITAVNTNSLLINVNAAWEGTIDNVSIMEVTSSDVALRVESSTGNQSPIEFRAGNSNYNSLFIGSQSGKYITTASANTAIGSGAMLKNLTSSFNTAVGVEALRSLTTGGNNTAVGVAALTAMSSGNGNVALGGGALFFKAIGDYNTAVGQSALSTNTSGSNNTALGRVAGGNNNGSGNVFIGYRAGYNETGSNKLYIENSDSATPLIFGDFAADALTINGTLAVSGGLTIGSGGTAILKHLSTTTSWDPAEMTAGTSVSTTVTVTGAVVGDVASAGFSQALPDGVLISASVSAADTVRVVLFNTTGSPVDLSSGTIRASINQY